jgi:hypothetical protein
MVQVAERWQAGRWKTGGRQKNERQTGCGQAVEVAERRQAGRRKVGGRHAEGRRCKKLKGGREAEGRPACWCQTWQTEDK